MGFNVESTRNGEKSQQLATDSQEIRFKIGQRSSGLFEDASLGSIS